MKTELLEALNAENEKIEAELAKARNFEMIHVYRLMDEHAHLQKRLLYASELPDEEVEELKPKKKKAVTA